MSYAALLALGFLALYGLSNLTVFGQTTENSLLGGYQDQTLIFLLYHYVNFPPLEFGAQTAVIGVVLAALIAASRRRWRDLATVVIAAPVAVLATNLFKDVAGRPPLVDSRNFAASFPSGHFAVAAAITLALLIVVPRTWLRWCAPILLAWTAMIGAGVQSMGWHRPSDILGGALLVAAVFLLVGSLFSKSGERVSVRRLWTRSSAAMIALVIVVLAFASAWKPIPWTVPFLAMAALLSTALIGWVALTMCRTTDRQRQGRQQDSGDLVQSAADTRLLSVE